MTVPSSFKRPRFAEWLTGSNDITGQFLTFGHRPGMVSLAGGLPAAELYPLAEVREATGRAFERHGPAILEYGPVEGLPELRRMIAARVAAETGGHFTADHVLVTTGSMQGLDLVGKVLLDPGDLVVVQSPTYLGALDAWRPRRPRYRRLDWAPDTDQDGGQDGALRSAKFVYAVPNYSNPTGVLVSQQRRAALLERVLRAGTWLVEDDPYHAIALDGPPGPSLLARCAALPDQLAGEYDGPVVYLGTVSKSLVPGLRCGWIVAAPGMIRALSLARQAADLSGSMLTQAVALELLESGFDHRHNATITAAYRCRRDALDDAAQQRLARWFEWQTPPGGMFVWLRAREQAIDTDALYRFAIEHGVAFVPGSVFDFAGEDRCAMRLNFTRGSPEILREGVHRLEAAVLAYLARPGG